MVSEPPSGSPIPGGQVLADIVGERPVRAFNIATITADLQVTTRPCLLMGWSLRETTGSAAAAAELFNGSTTGGSRAGEQALASGGSGGQVCPDDGVWCDSGLLIHVVSGSLTGSVWLKV